MPFFGCDRFDAEGFDLNETIAVTAPRRLYVRAFDELDAGRAQLIERGRFITRIEIDGCDCIR